MKTRIQSITPEGIHYTDEHGETRFIDFDRCFQNFMKPGDNFDMFKKTDAEKQISIEEFRAYFYENCLVAVVGGRNSIEKYIEFYTDPETRIDFDDAADLWQAAGQIVKNGWWLTDYT